MSRWVALWLIGVGCTSGDPPACEVEGRQTCTSQLVVRFRDAREGPFQLTLRDDVGMNLTIDCPDPDTGADILNGYQWVCGNAEVTIITDTSYFASEIEIGVGQLPSDTFPVEPYSQGSDACGNICTTGTVEI